MRNFCITLNEIAPAAYKFVRKEFDENVPHPNVIRSWLANSNINAEPGILGSSLETLRLRASEMAANEQKLTGGILFDEMAIRKMLQWSNNYKMMGFEQGLKENQSNAQIASEALVFMFNGVNDDIQIPVAYSFTTKSMDAVAKSHIVIEVLEAVIECGIYVTSITFDGLSTNPATCELLGAILNVFSDKFQPFFEVKGSKIYVIFDPSHMMKLARNTLGEKKVIFDNERKAIKWIYFERLVRFSEERNFRSMHKMTRKHIEYQSNSMNVKLAVQTLSRSTAAALEYLMNQRHSEFAGPEI